MGILKRTLQGFLVIIVLLVITVTVQWFRTEKANLPAETETAKRLTPGPYEPALVNYRFVDTSRPTMQNGEYAGADDRTLDTILWYPVGATGELPLTVYSHGFIGNKDGGNFMARYLASHGYVVVSANFPISNTTAPGGPNFEDVVNQPGDVSFLIDQILALEDKPFEGTIDESRIGLFGLSLGGLTTTLAAFHPDWVDTRTKAAISIAGPANIFSEKFFDHYDVPFLMIGGTEDSIVDYNANASPIPERITNGGLLTLIGGTHLGFDEFAMTGFRLLGNMDQLVCSVIELQADDTQGGNPFPELLGTEAQGILQLDELPMCQVDGEAMRYADQHALTKIAVHAFFESHFADSSESRMAHQKYLTETLPAEISAVTYQAALR
ncbi:MAG: prolyl oligopeptidase family serine peptidase [Gammaproteobacteria bacterium]|nr:prolyl oligopeptidase family serine peptidase [Gammaproteobacteria bacterium]